MFYLQCVPIEGIEKSVLMFPFFLSNETEQVKFKIINNLDKKKNILQQTYKHIYTNDKHFSFHGVSDLHTSYY